MQTRSQQLAQTIFEQVSEIEQKGDAYRKKYGSMAHKLPVLIRTAGLTQALAFVEARGADEHRKLLEHLAAVIGAGTREQLLDRSRTLSLTTYRRLTQDALTALLWYKRFAQSVLHVDANVEGE